MEHRETFDHLVRSAEPLSQQLEKPSSLAAVRFLLDYAHTHQPLRTEAAWRLSSKVERELERAAGIRPTGGWANLAGLLAGTDHLKAKRDGFILGEVPATDELTEEQLHIELVEAMTADLVPPATAASIFIALVVGVLDQLETKKSYPVDALAAVLEDAVQFARAVGECQAETVAEEGLPCFLDGSTSNRRVMQVLARDLLEDVFIPAGTVRDVGDGRFALAASVFGDVRIDKIDTDAQSEWLEAFLTAEGASPMCNSEARR